MTSKPGILPGFVVSVVMALERDLASTLPARQVFAIHASHDLNDRYGMVRSMLWHDDIQQDIAGTRGAAVLPWGRQ